MICHGAHEVRFLGLTSNVLYSVRAFVATVDGRNSTPSKAVTIRTKPTDSKARTNHSDTTIDRTSGSQESSSGSGSAAIGAGAAGAVLLVLVVAVILLWKFRLIPLKYFQGTYNAVIKFFICS